MFKHILLIFVCIVVFNSYVCYAQYLTIHNYTTNSEFNTTDSIKNTTNSIEFNTTDSIKNTTDSIKNDVSHGLDPLLIFLIVLFSLLIFILLYGFFCG